jgi:formate-dependent nitrite reductase membrane component NrfD
MKTLEDGRNVDEKLGALTGEAAQLEVKAPGEAFPVSHGWWQLPSKVTRETPTYYEQPVLKEPVWKWPIPTYFYAGGMSGALSVLGGALDLFGGERTHALAERCHRVGLAADLASAGLLIYDLGRPSRFYNMLRVFRPSSPMNLGTWILSGSGACSLAATLFPRGVLGRIGSVAGALLGVPLAGYTAVLLSSTAVPVWFHTRRTLPLLFVASSVASAGALLSLRGARTRREAAVVRRFAAVGQAAELVASLAVEREASQHTRVARPLRRGASGALWRAASILGAGALVATLWPGRRKRNLVAGVLGTAAGLAVRYAVHHAGTLSARDPRATFQPQRE